MKKFKKVMAMGLATMAAVSAMSMSAMAAELSADAVYLDNPTQERYEFIMQIIALTAMVQIRTVLNGAFIIMMMRR